MKLGCTKPWLDAANRPAIEVDTSLPGKRVVPLLDQLILWHGAPKRITLDNGPECTRQVLDVWAYEHNVALDFIDPGRPMQNGYLESVTGKFRDECLNVHWFRSLADARRLAGEWRESSNTERPHSALGERTPAQRMQYTTSKREVSHNGQSPYRAQVSGSAVLTARGRCTSAGIAGETSSRPSSATLASSPA
jgi:putative transposase